LIISDVLLFIGSVLMALAFNIFVLILGRFIVGMGIGFATMIVPVYLAEVSPKEYRGVVVSTNILFCTSG